MSKAKDDSDVVTIEELCDFSNGHGFGAKDWKSSGLPIIRIQNLNGSRHFNYFDGTPDAAWIVNSGDLLFAWAGVKGVSFGPTVWDGPIGVLNQHIYRVQPRPTVNERWLYHALMHVTADIEKKASGFKTSLVHVHKSDIAKAVVRAFSVEEQERIAAILDEWDFVIAKTEKLIACKKQAFEHLKLKLLFGITRIRGYLEPWKKTKLRDVLVERRQRSTGTEEVYSVSVHRGLVNQIEHLGRSFAATDTSNYNLVKNGDIVYTKSPTGEFPFGIIKQSKADRDVIVSPLYGVFTPATPSIGTFLDYYFDSPANTRNYLNPIIQKGAKNTIAITNSTFLSSCIVMPTSETESQAINEMFDTATREIDLLRASLELYRAQKRGLMEHLLDKRAPGATCKKGA